MNKIPGSRYKIRFTDCDMFGHLNNARYLDYMINARQDHLREAYDFDYGSYYKRGLGWVITQHELLYLQPARFDEEVCIRSALIGLEKNSLHVEMVMTDADHSQIKAILRSRFTLIDLKSGKRTSHDEGFMEWAAGLVLDGNLGDISLQQRVLQLRGEIRTQKEEK